MKNAIRLTVLVLSCLAAGACAGREIRRVAGCDRRLASAEKRESCRVCVTRPRPHVFLPDRPEGERCAPR